MNGTDIQYSVDDHDETDSMYKPLKPGDVNGDGGNTITPIIKNGVSNGRAAASNGKKPVSLNNPAAAAGSKDRISGSENSLLTITDEDEYLKRGMDEDGSFREGHYGHT